MEIHVRMKPLFSRGGLSVLLKTDLGIYIVSQFYGYIIVYDSYSYRLGILSRVCLAV